MRDGENGFTLPYEARAGDYAKIIQEVYQNKQKYAEMAKSSRKAFDERLNWDNWGATLREKRAEILNHRPTGHTEEATLSEMIEQTSTGVSIN